MMEQIEFDFIEQHLPRRPADAHKGTMGTLVSLTGSRGFAGAAVLSAKAALRSGVGLHYQVLPEAIYPIFGTAVHESVCVPVQGSAKGTLCAGDLSDILPILGKATAVLIGCGMGNNADTAAVLHKLLRSVSCPVIIDADGINALAANIHNLDGVQTPIILTPHVKEFSRLSGLSVEAILADPAQASAVFAAAHPHITLALKGHRTYVAQGDSLYVNTAGNSGMAKGGSGDVLAGVIASLTAQGTAPLDAAVMGVHLHALAGDLAAAKLSRTAMLPSDIIAALPEIFMKAEDSCLENGIE